jgi:serine phosphatase RsbU (regulator of sigma subunit)
MTNIIDTRLDIPDIRTLTIAAHTIPSTLKALDLHDFLLQQPGIPCLPVLDNEGGLVGVIYTREFLKTMSRAFMRELSCRLTATDFVNRHYFLAQVDDEVTKVLSSLLVHDPKLENDSIIVFEGNKLIGIVTVANLLLVISETQYQLLDRMELLSSRLKEEVDISARLQRDLMPDKELEFKGFHVSGLLSTSTEVGGDLFDYFIIDERYLILAMGDVSGHGVPSGMVVSSAKGALRTLPDDILQQPAKLLQHLNYAVFATGLMQRLMTFFYIVIDTKRMLATYGNAGHNFPYLYRASESRWIQLDDAAGLPLGIDEDEVYNQITIDLAKGDRLFLYTDGLIEEMDEAEEQFGYQRVADNLASLAYETPHEMITRMLDVLTQYANGRTFEDDVTMIGLHIAEQEEQVRQTVAVFKSPDEQKHPTPMERWFREHRLELMEGAELLDEPLGHTLVPVLTQGFFDSMSGSIPRSAWSEGPVLWAGVPLAGQISRIKDATICRVLQDGDTMISQIGLNTLLFGNDESAFLDLKHYFSNTVRIKVTHTGQKEEIINEILSFASRYGADDKRPYLPGMLPITLDEMLENGFMAAPDSYRESTGQVEKGARRELAEAEQVEVCYGINDKVLGISVTDPWGRFTPEILLRGFERYCTGGEIEAGVGGGGLYLLWRFCDYLHVHVNPGRHTVFTVFYSIQDHIDPEAEKSFQFTLTRNSNQKVNNDEHIPV